MQYDEFIDSLRQGACPEGLSPWLGALWYEAAGEWDAAHEIVQQMDDMMAARIHAYLHRREGDIWNSNYWHSRAGSSFPEHLSEEEEWASLVQELL